MLGKSKNSKVLSRVADRRNLASYQGEWLAKARRAMPPCNAFAADDKMHKGIDMSVAKIIFITSVLGASIGSSVAATTLTASLIECNPQFFQALYQHRAELKKVVRVEDDKKGKCMGASEG